MTGRCYCGARTLSAAAMPQTVAYCHCVDCRRISGAPVAAFAAFSEATVSFDPPLRDAVKVHPEARRWFCDACGSPMAATYTYLPGQVYVPIGLLDDADQLPPRLHAHTGSQLSWLHLTDDLPRISASSRDTLRAAGDPA